MPSPPEPPVMLGFDLLGPADQLFVGGGGGSGGWVVVWVVANVLVWPRKRGLGGCEVCVVTSSVAAGCAELGVDPSGMPNLLVVVSLASVTW